MMLHDALLPAFTEQKLCGSFCQRKKESNSSGGKGYFVWGRVEKREGEIIKSICGNLKFQPGIHQQRVYIKFSLSFSATWTRSIQAHLPDKS